MTKDEIISMAHVVGVVEFLYSNPHLSDAFEFLQRFAALVAAAERRKHQADIEKWKAEAATAEKWRGLALSKEGDGRCVQRIHQEAAEKEREACAALCDDIVQEEEGKLDRNYTREDTAEELAVLIRASGQQ